MVPDPLTTRQPFRHDADLPSNGGTLSPRIYLRIPAAKQIVFLASGAIRASHATHEQDGDAHRYQDRQQGAIGCNPVHKALHFA